MNDKKDHQTMTEIRFEKTVCQSPCQIRTQTLDRPAASWESIEDSIWDMFDDPDEFVTLTLETIRYNIRYVQATLYGDMVTVQLGIEEDDCTRLVEKTCSQRECLDIFHEFYTTTNVPDLQAYTPVEFYK